MSVMAEIERKLLHYKKYLERYLEDKSRENEVYKILRKLDQLPVTLDHLQLTGIGKAVNSFRKHAGDVGRESKSLVSKWKSLVPGVKVENKQTSVQCETVSETSYHAQEIQEYESDPLSSTHRVPYLQSTQTNKPSKLTPERQEAKASKDHKSSKHKKHRSEDEKQTKQSNQSEEKLLSSSRSEQSKDKHKHGKEKVKEKHKDEDRIKEGDTLHDKGKNKDRGKEKNKDRDKSRNKDKVRDEEHRHHEKDHSTRETCKKKHDDSRKRKADFRSDSSNDKKAKTNVQSSPTCGNDRSVNDDNEGGLSFEDLLKFDEELLKRVKKKKVTSSSETHTNKDKGHSATSSHSDNNNLTKRASPHRQEEYERKKSQSSKGKSSISKSFNEVQQKRTEFSVPPPPTNPVRLSEVDILEDLPKTNPNYRPLPHLTPKESDKSHSKGILIDEDYLGTKRNTKTQVYSGKRAIYLQEVPTLYDACLRVLMDNIDNLEYVGGIPAEILKPVLIKCTASQLYTLEEYNPHFIGETDDIWEKLCNKEFRNETPEEFESWRELYLRKHDEREARLKRLTSNIAESYAKKQEPVKKTKLAYVDTVAKPPRNVLRQQIKHGTAGPTKVDPLSQLSSHGGQPVKHVVAQNTVEPPAAKKRKPVPPMMQKAMKLFKSMRR